MKGLVVRVDREACTGAGVCAQRAPHTFSLDAERKAGVAEPPADPEEAILGAARSCPNFAIELLRDGVPIG